MEKIRNIFKNKGKKGFSLIEVLAAVIIVAIMAAIGIIMIPQLMEQGRETTDVNNMKEASTLMNTYILQGGENNTMYFDAESGNLVKEIKDIKSAYGKGTTRDGGTADVYNPDGSVAYTAAGTDADYRTKVIKVDYKTATSAIEDNGEINVSWVTKTN